MKFELMEQILSWEFGIYFLIIGIAGQLMFSSRFIIQWLASEKRKESVVPKAFWYFSFFGGVMILTYGIYLKEPVLILGQIFNPIIYLRNLVLLEKTKAKESTNA